MGKYLSFGVFSSEEPPVQEKPQGDAKEEKVKDDEILTIVIVLSQHNVLGSTLKQTGWYLPEVAHPIEALQKSKKTYRLIFASPNGGKTDVDEGSVKDWVKDKVCVDFLKSRFYQMTKKTVKYADIDMSKVSCVFYPGGHGPMWDLATDEAVAKKTAEFYERGGLVAAVCHGPAALVPVVLQNGNSILKGKNCTGFTNEEEDIMKLTDVMPFLLETRMTELGGNFDCAKAWDPHVVVDGNLITGQNPASGTAIGEAIDGYMSKGISVQLTISAMEAVRSVFDDEKGIKQDTEKDVKPIVEDSKHNVQEEVKAVDEKLIAKSEPPIGNAVVKGAEGHTQDEKKSVEDIGTIVIVITQHNQLGDTGKQTGWYLPELAHPLEAFAKSNKKYTLIFASPNGGNTEVDEGSVRDWEKDPVCSGFLKSDEYERTKNTVKYADVDMKGVTCVFYPGGHGPMWDLANNQQIAKKTAEFYEHGGLVAAVCHGPAALIPIILQNGDSVLKGKRCTAFTNKEEDIMNLTDVMPFLLETKVIESGAKFESAEAWIPFVVVDGNLITGQNPSSGAPLGEAIVKYLSDKTSILKEAQYETTGGDAPVKDDDTQGDVKSVEKEIKPDSVANKSNELTIVVEHDTKDEAKLEDIGIIVIVLTQHNKLGDTGKQTGWYLPELAHPVEAFAKSNKKYRIVYSSPNGGKSEVDEGSVKDWANDPCCAKFLESEEYERTKNTVKFADVDMTGVSCIFYTGGHGPMWDLANDKVIAAKTAEFYENGGLVAAVCHGPAALVPIVLKNGDSILKGKRCTGFTNIEEDIMKLTDAMPFLLETKMIELEAKFDSSEAWKPFVVEDGNLITGQNPYSGAPLGNAIIEYLSKAKSTPSVTENEKGELKLDYEKTDIGESGNDEVFLTTEIIEIEESKSNSLFRIVKSDDEKEVLVEKDDLGTIVIILTQHTEMGDTGKQTGWYLPELAHPLEAITKSKKKYNIIFASALGGKTEVDEGSVKDWENDQVCAEFLKSDEYERTKNTVKFTDIDMKGVTCVFYPGGHGPMWDLANDKDVANKTGEFYDNGGLVVAVCHGPAALVPIVLNNGNSILDGKVCTCFTNDEEDIMKLSDIMPFLLETRMIELGGKFKNAEAWNPFVVVDGNLITGQNPASGAKLGVALVDHLSGKRNQSHDEVIFYVK